MALACQRKPNAKPRVLVAAVLLNEHSGCVWDIKGGFASLGLVRLRSRPGLMCQDNSLSLLSGARTSSQKRGSMDECTHDNNDGVLRTWKSRAHQSAAAASGYRSSSAVRRGRASRSAREGGMKPAAAVAA